MSKSSAEAIQDLNAEVYVKGWHPKAYAERRGFWFVFSDPDLPESESYLGSAICKKDAWRNAWHNVKRTVAGSKRNRHDHHPSTD